MRQGKIIYHAVFIVAAGVLLAYLYRLKLPYGIALMCAAGCVLPVWMREQKKREREQIRFTEANLYMEQVLYSFRKSPKILSALTDVEKLFVRGSMSECIRKAIAYIKETYEGEHIAATALEIIEKEFPSSGITDIHRLMVNVERLGGNCEDSIRILLKNRNIREKETISYQKHCQVQKRNITVAIFLSAGLCLMTPVLCQSSLKSVNIMNTTVYQLTTLLMLILEILIYLYTEKYFSKDWLLGKEFLDAKSSIEKYEKVMYYDFSKARKKSFVCGTFMGIVAGLFAFFGKWVVTAALLPIVILLFFQHRLDYALAKKVVVREIRKAFPDWLMEVALLLQTENVAVSIQKSIEFAPEILKPELELLVAKLEAAPESNLAYSEFLQKFAISEVTSAMGMLYSISDGGGSDASVQIEEILSRNAKWQEEAEALLHQEQIGKMYLLFLLPALLGTFKMIVDMTLILLAFFVQ